MQRGAKGPTAPTQPAFSPRHTTALSPSSPSSPSSHPHHHPQPSIIILTMTNIKSNMSEQQTRIDSPFKTLHHIPAQSTESLMKESIQYLQPASHLSQTQIHLNSRSIVRKLLKQSNNKTIRHEINQIDKDSQLYAKPSRYSPTEFKFNHIPPKNKNYASSCSAKIKQINEGLRQSVSAKTRCHSEAKESTVTVTRQERISISGLISYKFNSINAQRSLGFNQINHEEKLTEDIRNSRKLGLCPANRFKKILLKTNPKKYKQKLRQEKSILSKDENSTANYLKLRIRQNDEERFVYGEKARNLHFIKEYMVSEKTDYEEGRFVIDEIERCRPEQVIRERERTKCRTEVDEDFQLSNRRMPARRRPVNVRFTTFVD